ncbi:MAG: hypothetical protein JWM61_2557, partial [Micrococcaceae bacterium]|nr:hypothetical protein [Micrococcaceae bacterium]
HDGGDNEAISRLQVAERFLAEARVLAGSRRKGTAQGRSGA